LLTSSKTKESRTFVPLRFAKLKLKKKKKTLLLVESNGDLLDELLKQDDQRARTMKADEEFARKLQIQEAKKAPVKPRDDTSNDEALARHLQATLSRQVRAPPASATGSPAKHAAAAAAAAPQITPQTQYHMNKLCRLRKVITCGDLWEGEDILLLGGEDGLVGVDLHGMLPSFAKKEVIFTRVTSTRYGATTALAPVPSPLHTTVYP